MRTTPLTNLRRRCVTSLHTGLDVRLTFPQKVEAALAPSKKRKPEADAAPAVKKVKTLSGDAAPAAQGTSVFVGSLSWNIDEEWLKSEFEECGEITSARVITDRESGRSKGCVHSSSS